MLKIRALAVQSFRTLKESYSYILSAVLIFATIFIVYGNDLQMLVNEALSNEAFTHILLVPFFAGFLYYLKIKMVKASVFLEKLRKKAKVKHINELMGVIICLIAFLIYWYGSHTFYPLRHHIFSLPIFAIGVILIIFNLKTAVILLLPTLFLFFLVPPPMEFLYSVGGFVANFETQIVYVLSKAFGLPVQLSSTYGPPIIQLTTTSYGGSAHFAVDLPCSGVYSLITFVVFATFLIAISKASIARRLLIFPVGFLTFEALNIARIVSIISIAYFLGEEIAMVFFHSAAGLILTFVGMLLILIVSEKILKIQVFSKPQHNLCPKCNTNRRSGEIFCSSCGGFLDTLQNRVSPKTLAKILLLLSACTLLIFSINAPTFAIAKDSIKVGPTVTPENSIDILPEVEGYRLSFLYRDINYERVAGQDAALVYAYFPVNYSNPTIFVSINVASSLSNLHSWEVCLITWQTAHGRYPLVDVLSSDEKQILEDPPIIARYLAFKTPQNYTQLTLYWFERAPFETVIVKLKYVRISLIIITYENSNYDGLKDELLNFGEKIASYWEPLKTQSLISLGVSALQLLLIFSAALTLFIKISQYIYETTKRKRNLKIFRRTASKEDKLILDVLSELAKENRSIGTKEIANALRRKGKFMKTSRLIEKLEYLEEYGFVKREVVSVDNIPRLIWKFYS